MEINRNSSEGLAEFSPPVRIGDRAPVFNARSTQGDISLADFRGRWVILFFHPADFTPVCTSEIAALALRAHEFAAADCALIGLSVDSLYSHLAWIAAIQDQFEVEVRFPIVEDPSMAICLEYGMLRPGDKDSSAARCCYFVDPDGVVRATLWYPTSVGRSVDEMLRILKALQRVHTGDGLTPEGWQPGGQVLQIPPQLAEKLSPSNKDGLWFHRFKDGK